MRQIIDWILTPQGYEIFAVEDGAQALGNGKKINPDLVLLDVRLPDMESLEIMKELKKIKPGLPVLILSGFGDIEAALELVKQGAFNYLPKPFKVDDLRQMVKKAINQQVAAAIDVPAQEIPAGDSPKEQNESKSPVIKYLICAAAILLLAAGGSLFWKWRSAGATAVEYAIAYTNPSAICWDGKYVWIADWASETIYRHARDEKFSVSANFKMPGIVATGLAYDGKYLWVSNSFSQKIYKRSTDSALSEAALFSSPGPSPSGLCFDGKNLWSADFQQGKIYKHASDKTLSIAATYGSPAANPCGLFKYGKYFFIADANTNRIFKVDPASFKVKSVFILPQYEDQQHHITSIAWDGNSLWVCSDGNQKILRCGIRSLKPIKM
jgi:CheY-like chemotaxis protein/sugar lactone lactonase YvrE